MRGSKLNNRNYNVKYKLPGQLNQPRGPTPPPVDPKYPPERAEDEEEGSSQKTGQYWYYSDHAGGMVLPYRKHYGEKMHSVPLSYLKWCYNKLTYATTFRRAFERYYDGLRQWVMDGNYGEIVVPVGHTYRGMKLKNCRDKQWMVWLRKWTRQYRPKDLDKHDIFFLAVDEWVKHPRHQDAIRDIGELLARTEYEDDMDLQEGEEYVDEDADELDEEGNLKHFIEVVDEPDSNEDYTDSEGSSSSGASDADEESAEETEDSEDEMHSVFPTPPPETPKKRRRREVSSEEELESELEFVAQSPSDSKPRSVSLRSGKLVTFGDCVAEVLPTPPPDSSRKRPRLDTPGECGPSHLSQGDCSPLSEKTRANPQMRLPITPKTFELRLGNTNALTITWSSTARMTRRMTTTTFRWISSSRHLPSRCLGLKPRRRQKDRNTAKQASMALGNTNVLIMASSRLATTTTFHWTSFSRLLQRHRHHDLHLSRLPNRSTANPVSMARP